MGLIIGYMITVLSSEAKLNYPVIRGNYNGCKYNIEVCMGMGLIGIPWVPWDFHGNGNHCDSIMGMGMGITAWEWKLNNGNGNGFPLYLFSTKSNYHHACMRV